MSKRTIDEVKTLVTIDDHEVRWVYYAYDHGERGLFDGYTIECSCNDELDALKAKGLVAENYSNAPAFGLEPRSCLYREAACKLQALKGEKAIDAWMKEELGEGRHYYPMRGNLHPSHKPEWAEKEFLEVYQRMGEGEWLGQRQVDRSRMVYAQEIGAVMAISGAEAVALAHGLFKEKKIGLTGALVSEWDGERDEPRDDDDSTFDDATPPTGEAIKGKLFFYSETGTEGGYWAFQKDGTYSDYDGMHTLSTGDYLTIYGPREYTGHPTSDSVMDEVDWQGYIRLRHYNLFTESADGMWIHADQRGVNRKRWANYFFKGRPAELIVRP